MNKEHPIFRALRLPKGARFYHCALQVNPFDYVRRHAKSSPFLDEDLYNEAIIDACKKNQIDVIGITDHQRSDTGQKLAEAAQKAGIYVFPGAELETKEGSHFLLLFDPQESLGRIRGILGDCGIHDQAKPPTNIKYDVQSLIEECRKSWRAICVAAHVTHEKGLLKVLNGQARINAWTLPNLLACSLPGSVSEAPEKFCLILENKDPQYKRQRPVAIINAQDVSHPDDLAKPGAACWIKMSMVSIEGLRQAFLDPESRIRLASDPEPEEHAEFVALGWQAGFLGDAAIHFNENLNVLVGGRGTGKSTIVESLRYVLGLDPICEDATKAHQGIIQHVLRSGTKVSLLVRSPHPSKKEYLIERTIPNPPIVRSIEGDVLNLSPIDILPHSEVYGQHEISELARSPEKRTRLLRRFVEPDTSLESRKNDIRYQLEISRNRILEADRELSQIEERLAALPALEEMLKRFQDAHVEEQLKEQSLIVREEQVLKAVSQRLDPFRAVLREFEGLLPIDRVFLSRKALESLPGKDILSKADNTLNKLDEELKSLAGQMRGTLNRAEQSFDLIRSEWEVRKTKIQEVYLEILRQLQKSRVDGEEFLRLRRQIEELRPLRDRQATLKKARKQYQQERQNLLADWEDVKAMEYQRLERAAKKVNRELLNYVDVRVNFCGNREPLFQLLRERIGGRLSESVEMLQGLESFSLKDFADSCREGSDVLVRKYHIPSTQAERLAKAPLGIHMEIEELDLPATTEIKLNVAREGDPLQWQPLDALSTGQKATAILLLLLLEFQSEAPLVIDQPEDDLDNRFITEVIVPKMRKEKRCRQFVFATHNANIPVLGDAELIIGLVASGEAEEDGKARIPSDTMGSIDSEVVCHLVEEVLEGGRAAFEMRRLKYGF